MTPYDFLEESNRIEGILRGPTGAEKDTFDWFMRGVTTLDIGTLCALQTVFAPGKPLRTQIGMDVRVGSHIPPRGGPAIGTKFAERIDDMTISRDPWAVHCQFQTLHPFMDGNGRTGRMLWAWHMQHLGRDPFALPFLHRFYYQTLEHGDGR